MVGIPVIEPYAMPTAAELPLNIANWKIDPSRAVLLIHDMQAYFIRPLPYETPRSRLIKNIAAIRQRCVAAGIQIAYTAQTGSMTKKQRGLLNDFWGPGMEATLIDRNVIDELAPALGDWIFSKWRYSAFYRSKLLQQMRNSKRDQLIICGVYAHIGVLATAIEAFSHDIETFLIADAIADFSAYYHSTTLNYAAECCAVVMLTDEVLQ